MWQDDGVYAVGGFGEASGRGSIAALIEAPLHRQMMADGCAHVLSPVVIDLDGDDARAIGYSIVFRHLDGRFSAERVSANRWTLRRNAEGWKVVRRDNALLDGNEAARALLALSPPAA